MMARHSRFLSGHDLAKIIAALLVLASASLARAQESLAVLKTFGAPPNDDGAFPVAHLMQASDGMLYGTTEQGGTSNLGTIFKMATDGSDFAVIHTFTGPDGGLVDADLIQVNGLLYGTTSQGGSSNLGAIFSMATDGTGFTIVHSFTAGGIDGAQPAAPLMQASDGMLYGTTKTGGTNGDGTVFRMSPDGNDYRVLYSFTGAPCYSSTDDLCDGDYPLAGLIQADDGMLYGTTAAGGTEDLGTVFRIALDGTNYAVVHNFIFSATDGMEPVGTLMQATNGTLYGTTEASGFINTGTVYQINPDGGGYSTLHYFTGGPTDGSGPSGLIQGGDGTIYGTTGLGGTSNDGTIFQMAPDGSGFSVLVAFDALATGRNPDAALLLASDGKLYGTNSEGGSGCCGVVFQLTLPPSAPQSAIDHAQRALVNSRLTQRH